MDNRAIRLDQIYSENRKALLRMFIFGNAGGAIATLSLIGTIIGASDDHRFDMGALLVLILFLVGLASGAVSRYADIRWADTYLQQLDTSPEDPGRNARAKQIIRWKQVHVWAFRLTGGTLTLGVVLGLVQLGSFSK